MRVVDPMGNMSFRRSGQSVDVLGIGNAIVDLLCPVEDGELEKKGLLKGSMALVDDVAAQQLHSQVQPVSVQSGGSVANSLFHSAQMGAKCHLVGKVADDETGQRFRDDAERGGVKLTTTPLAGQHMSGCCFVFVTPDGQRTMCTFLGASAKLSDVDIDAAAIAAAKVLLIEGYLWSSVSARQMILKSAAIAHQSDTLVAFSLSDSYLVSAHQEEFQEFIENYVDLLFANEHEAYRLFDTDSLATTVDRLKRVVDHLVVTRGESGSVAYHEDNTYECSALSVEKVVDTTGAGDAYAGGYLYGLTQGYSIEQCMKIATQQSTDVIGHYGGRIAKESL